MIDFGITDFAILGIDCIYTTVFKQKQQKSEASLWEQMKTRKHSLEV
jgi:hypothetical protein